MLKRDAPGQGGRSTASRDTAALAILTLLNEEQEAHILAPHWVGPPRRPSGLSSPGRPAVVGRPAAGSLPLAADQCQRRARSPATCINLASSVVATSSETGGPLTTSASAPSTRVTPRRMRSRTPSSPGPTSVTPMRSSTTRVRPRRFRRRCPAPLRASRSPTAPGRGDLRIAADGAQHEREIAHPPGHRLIG